MTERGRGRRPAAMARRTRGRRVRRRIPGPGRAANQRALNRARHDAPTDSPETVRQRTRKGERAMPSGVAAGGGNRAARAGPARARMAEAAGPTGAGLARARPAEAPGPTGAGPARARPAEASGPTGAGPARARPAETPGRAAPGPGAARPQ